MGLTARHSFPAFSRFRERGFTFIELLVVLIIAGIALGLTALNAMPSDRQALQNEAQRIALLLQLARDEAIVRNRPVAFEGDADRYRFLIYDSQQWQPIVRDELLRERAFRQIPTTLSIAPASSAQTNPLRIVFGREPVDRPFVLTLSAGAASASIRADGIGHFTVE